jgi:hypothetical protein
MKRFAAAACVALLGSAPAFAHPASPDSMIVSSTDPATGKRTVRPATPAERAEVEKSLKGIQPSLAGLQASLAPLKHLDRDLAPLKGLDASLANLKDLGPKLARLQRMVETETPVSTFRTGQGLVRVYRDGTIVTDSGGNRTFDIKD